MYVKDDSSPWKSGLLLVFELLLGYVICVAIYRLKFHPLAKYPGPLFSRLTGWSIVFQAAGGDRHLESWEEHETYGPIVRIGPNALSINTIAAIKDIYAARNANVQRSDWYRTIDATSEAFSTHSEIDPHKHAFRRRVLDHAFSDTAVRSAEHFIHDNVQRWLAQLGGEPKRGGWSPSKNMSEWCSYVGFDIMGDLTFGQRFNCVESEEHRYVPEINRDSTKFIYALGFLPCIDVVRPLMGTATMALFAGHLSRSNVKYVEYANTQMARRIAAEKDPSTPPRKDFMHYLINAKDPQTGRGLTIAELNADSSLLIAAGSDTTATVLAATLFYLLHYPSVLEKLAGEIRSTFASVEQIDGKSLRQLVYLRACVDESLRMCPPVPGHLPREVLPGGLTVDGHYFPPKTVVGTCPYAIHHNPEYYPDPFKYRPERWIVDEAGGGISSPDAVATARAAFCPFSLGRRGCIGKSVAYLELEIGIAKLLYLYDIRIPEGEAENGPSGGGASHHKNPARRRSDEYQIQDYFISIRDGPMVQFSAREDTKF